MKKYLFILACACMAFAACDPEQKPGDDNSVPGLDELPDIGGGGNEGNKPTQELTPGEQQAKLQSVGEKMLAEFPAEEFENLAAISEAFDRKFSGNEDYDLSDLEKWVEDAVEFAFNEDEKETPIENGYHQTSTTELLLLLSNHTGLFTFGANKVTVAPYKGVKAVITVEGKTYEAELTSSGNVTTAYFRYESHYEERYGSGNDMHHYKYDGEAIITVGVPESIDIAITENGTPLATVNARFQARFTPEGLNLSTDALSTEFTAVINGYELKVSKTGYDGAASKAQMMTTLSRDGKALLTSTASADLRLKEEIVEYNNSYNEDNWTDEFSRKATEIIVEKCENGKVALDILGEIQVVGTCSDVNKANDEINSIYRALSDYDYETGNSKTPDEAAAARHTENLNRLVDFAVYYDNGSNKQADIEFEYYYGLIEEEWGTFSEYGLYPVIVFNNGSRNKIEDFFTEEAFSSLIDSVQEFGDSYETVFGWFFEKEDAVMPDIEY